MSYARKVRFEYYEVVFKEKDDPADVPDRYFDMNLWINKADKFSLAARTFDYYQERARLDKIWYGDSSGYWYLNFLRLRDTNIPTKAKEDKEAEPMELDDDEYIGENVTALYDEKIGIIMLQRNRYSLSVTGIEKYLNLIWNSDDETIHLRPIAPIDIQEKVKNAYEYRKIRIRFADVFENKAKVSRYKPIKQAVDLITTYKGLNAEINISLGYNKNKELDIATVRDTIDEIKNNKDIIDKAEITFKETDDAKVETLDLFEDKMHSFISYTFEKRMSIVPERLAIKMEEKYNDKRNLIIKAKRKR